MNVGERIAARRKELDMTQEQLAKRLGYKSKSSINKIEMQWANVPLSKLEEVAAALDCDPAYLMGWDESEKTVTDSDGKDLTMLLSRCTDEQREMIRKLVSLPPEKLSALLKLTEPFLSGE